MKSSIIFIISLFIIGCKGIGEAIPLDVPVGAYYYTGYDTLTTIIVRGWLKFEMQDSIRIKGEWDFEEVGSPKNIGPQIGQGVLIGGKSDTSIWMNLNPRYIDHNIYITGKIENQKINGKWEWITFAGRSNWGTFEAVLKK